MNTPQRTFAREFAAYQTEVLGEKVNWSKLDEEQYKGFIGWFRERADKRAACEKAGLIFTSASAYGYVAGKFEHSIRIESLSFAHHAKLSIEALTSEQRDDLLRQAANAKPKPVPSNGTRAPTLADMGINYDQAAKWQKLSDIPEEDFGPFFAP